MMVVKISRTQGMATCLAIWMSGAMVGLPWSGWAQGSAGNVREAEAPETRAISSTNGVPALPAQRFDALRRLATDYRPDCVIELIWQACLTYSIESRLVRALAENDLGVPYLMIETDYSPSDSERIAVRVEALFETVRARKHR